MTDEYRTMPSAKQRVSERPGGTVQNPNICVRLALPVFFSAYRKCRGSLVDWQLPPSDVPSQQVYRLIPDSEISKSIGNSQWHTEFARDDATIRYSSVPPSRCRWLR